MTHTLFNEFHDEKARTRLSAYAERHTSPKDAIDAIIKTAFGHKAELLARFVQGEDSEVYAIMLASGEEQILRISHKNEDTFSIEEWAMNAVRAKGVPVPGIIASGAYTYGSKTLRYMVQQKLPGRTLDHMLWVERISPARAKKITVAAGELLACIHQVHTDGWGSFTQPGITEFNTLSERWNNIAAHEGKFIEALKPYRHLGLPPVNQILEFIKTGYLLSDGKQCLVQNDFAPKHLFIDKHDSIIGVIDFEDVQSADPAQDLAEWQFWFEESVPEKWLRAGHERVDPLGDDYLARLGALRVERALWLLNYYASSVPDDEWGRKAALYIRDTMHGVDN